MKKQPKKPSKSASLPARSKSTSSARYLQSEGFISRVNQDGTVILMHLSDVNSFFKMNKFTAAIWPELRQVRSCGAMVEHFAKLLPQHAAEIAKAMPLIFEELVSHKLIEPTTEDESSKFETTKLKMDKFERGSVQIYNLDKIETEVLNESIYLDVFAGSDMRLKTEVAPLENALQKIAALDGVSYEWNAKAKRAAAKRGVNTKQRRAGLIAQQVAEQMPELVRMDQESGMLAINYAKMNAYLVEAVKELSRKVETLETRLAKVSKK